MSATPLFDDLVKQIILYLQNNELNDHGTPLQADAAAKGVLLASRFGKYEVGQLLLEAVDYFEAQSSDPEPDWPKFVNTVLGHILADAVRRQMGPEYQRILDRRLGVATGKVFPE